MSSLPRRSRTFARTALGLAGACCSLAPLLTAQTTSTTPTVTTPATGTPATTPPATTVPPSTGGTPTVAPSAPRFTSFANAPAPVATAVATAAAAAAAARSPVGVASGTTGPALATAVAGASQAIVQDARTVRSNLLAERQAAVDRLRLAQSAPERQRLVDELRTRTGQRLDEQRETARLVRDRLRELRDVTALTPKPPGS